MFACTDTVISSGVVVVENQVLDLVLIYSLDDGCQ